MASSILYNSSAHLHIRSSSTRQRERNMGNPNTIPPSSSSGVNKIQQVLHSHSTGGRKKCWHQGLPHWNVGQPTPLLKHLHNIGALPKGRALVPGCGSGHDVAAIACRERYAVGLDISDKAIRNAIEVDFFNWHPDELFDLIFYYTFFCGIEPEMRSAWARQIEHLLKPDGELIILMFPISGHVGGPPYGVSIADYEEVLNPVGLKAMSIVENELAVGPLKGREKLGRCKRFVNSS